VVRIGPWTDALPISATRVLRATHSSSCHLPNRVGPGNTTDAGFRCYCSIALADRCCLALPAQYFPCGQR